jgi:hypothetical protein
MVAFEILYMQHVLITANTQLQNIYIILSDCVFTKIDCN